MPIYTVEKLYSSSNWYKNDKLHRNGNLPSIEWNSNTKWWYKNGKRHRDGDLPAIKFDNGTKYWHKNGKYHRNGDLPAIEYNDGSKEWYKNNIRYYPNKQLIIINTVIKIKIMKMGNKWWYQCRYN